MSGEGLNGKDVMHARHGDTGERVDRSLKSGESDDWQVGNDWKEPTRGLDINQLSARLLVMLL